MLEWDERAYADGRKCAAADIAVGRLVYHWRGHAGHWGHWIVTQFAERFGLGVDGFAICLVSDHHSFTEGYNAVIAETIDFRHGAGALESVFVEAKAQSEESLGDARRLWLERHPEG